jgi:hypothetical protein
MTQYIWIKSSAQLLIFTSICLNAPVKEHVKYCFPGSSTAPTPKLTASCYLLQGYSGVRATRIPQRERKLSTSRIIAISKTFNFNQQVTILGESSMGCRSQNSKREDQETTEDELVPLPLTLNHNISFLTIIHRLASGCLRVLANSSKNARFPNLSIAVSTAFRCFIWLPSTVFLNL